MSLLKGIRILSVEQYGAGPFATEYLASLGAEIIKIEDPGEGGDVSRYVGPHFDSELPETAKSYFFHSLNTNKKSLTLNLRHEHGRALFRQLAAESDAVLSNLRGDVPAKLGLTYEQLSTVNSRIVCAHLTGYGREGPRAHWPGYDYLMQAEAGYFSLTGDPSGPPARMGLSVIDYMTGVVMSLGLVSGILDAQRSGTGSDVDVSLFDVAIHNLNYLASWYLNAGAETVRQPRSAHPSLAPCQLYRTRDGWIYLMCNKEKFWKALCRSIERPELVSDPRFVDFPFRFEHRDELTTVLDEALGVKTTAEWLLIFGGAVPASPVLSVSQALESDFVKGNDRIFTVQNSEGQQVKLLRNPIKSSKPLSPVVMAPTLGQHTEELLIKAGLSHEEIAALRASRIV